MAERGHRQGKSRVESVEPQQGRFWEEHGQKEDTGRGNLGWNQ